ncbi:MAG: aminotransferase class IV [Maribacter sp.]|nr:MAG: aminotransferase class IV [Maribacter sp.]
MINFNGGLLQGDSNFLNHGNRGLRYGDALFESVKVVNSKIYFWESHYLRLMSSMRILRMEIPMDFTMEFLEEQILYTLRENDLDQKSARVRLTVFRNNGGLYTPASNDVSYIIEADGLHTTFYSIGDKPYEVALFKDFFLNPDMLSNLKTNNRILNVVGSIFAKENGLDNCLLLNTRKSVVEALNGNLFLVQGNEIRTPPLSDGCLRGIVRNKLIGILGSSEDYSLTETSISPFELQKADELFITNAIVGIQPITKYRKKLFGDKVSRSLLGKLNVLARLG